MRTGLQVTSWEADLGKQTVWSWGVYSVYISIVRGGEARGGEGRSQAALDPDAVPAEVLHPHHAALRSRDVQAGGFMSLYLEKGPGWGDGTGALYLWALDDHRRGAALERGVALALTGGSAWGKLAAEVSSWGGSSWPRRGSGAVGPGVHGFLRETGQSSGS